MKFIIPSFGEDLVIIKRHVIAVIWRRHEDHLALFKKTPMLEYHNISVIFLCIHKEHQNAHF